LKALGEAVANAMAPVSSLYRGGSKDILR
jgi:hypothetical protein